MLPVRLLWILGSVASVILTAMLMLTVQSQSCSTQKNAGIMQFHGLLLNFIGRVHMADAVELGHLYNLAEQLVEKASKEDVAECARQLALIVTHYKMKFGEIDLDDTLAMVDIDKPSHDQIQILANGMETLIDQLANIVTD